MIMMELSVQEKLGVDNGGATWHRDRSVVR